MYWKFSVEGEYQEVITRKQPKYDILEVIV